MVKLTHKQKEIIKVAREWGYFKGSIIGLSALYKNKRVLDVGMGGGPYSVVLIALGAESYCGVDPLVGSEHVKDNSANKENGRPNYHAFPYSADEIMKIFPQIKLYSGFFEDFEKEVLTFSPQVAILSAVTEHLTDTKTVFESIWGVLDKNGILFYSHSNYYSWIGHHEQPRNPAQLNLDSKEHMKVIDWQHLEVRHHRYKDVNLNRMRMTDLRIVTENFFEIEDWKEIPVAIDKMTTAIRKKYSHITLSELFTATLYVVAIKREVALGYDLSNLQLHHPSEEYLKKGDYGDEKIAPYLFFNGVYFTPNLKYIASHSDNDNGGLKLFKKLEKGDKIAIKKGLQKLFLTIDEILSNKIKIVEKITAEEVEESGRRDWSIRSVERKGVKMPYLDK